MSKEIGRARSEEGDWSENDTLKECQSQEGGCDGGAGAGAGSGWG